MGAPKGQVLVQTSTAEVNQRAASSVQNSGAVASSSSAATASTTCSSSVATASVSGFRYYFSIIYFGFI